MKKQIVISLLLCITQVLYCSEVPLREACKENYRPSVISARNHGHLNELEETDINVSIEHFRKESHKQNGLFTNINEGLLVLRQLANRAINKHYSTEYLNLIEFFLDIFLETQHQIYDQKENANPLENATDKLRSCLGQYPQLVENLSNDLYPCAKKLLTEKKIKDSAQNDRPRKKKKILGDSKQQLIVEPMLSPSQISNSQSINAHDANSMGSIIGSQRSQAETQRILEEQKRTLSKPTLQRPVSRVLFPLEEERHESPQESHSEAFSLSTQEHVLYERSQPTSPSKPVNSASTNKETIKVVEDEKETVRSNKKKWLGLAALLGSAGGAYLLHVNKENKKNEKVKKESRVDSEEAINTGLLNHSREGFLL